jgi:hypothetical protein
MAEVSDKKLNRGSNKLAMAGKKLDAAKWQNFAKSGRKEAGNDFSSYLVEKPYNYL